MSEQVDLKKAVTSVATPVYWVKTLMYGLGLLAIFLVGNAVYKQYFQKKQPQTIQQITVQPGGQVAIHNEAPKKHWCIFTEPYGALATDDRTEFGVRIGFRWEFN